MSKHDDERFRVRPGAPKQRDDAFINKVLRQTNKAGAKLGKAVGKVGHRPGSRLGRGHVAARFAGASLAPNARRVTIKARLVNLSKAGSRSTVAHLRYIEREGVDRQGGPGHAYGPTTDAADTAAFEERGREDRHQFRFIVSPEDAEQLDDLRTYTRHLMARMEGDLGTRLDWVAVDHWNTDTPHTHVVLRGKDDTGKDLIISRDYIAEGMRHRAAELATEWLGPRTELDIQRAMQREVDQERWTGLDRTLLRETVNGLVLPAALAEPRLQRQRQVLIGRLQYLQRMGLASEQQPGAWGVHANAESTLRAMGERGDIIRTMQRAMSGRQRELATPFDVDRGRTQLETTRSRIPSLEAQVAMATHRIAVLTGETPDALVAELEVTSSLPTLPKNAAVDAPSDLLRRRPDVAAAERRLAAATARIGVATADLFPRFTLGGLIGMQAFDAGVLFERDAQTRLLSLGVDGSFLNVGRVRARIAAANAAAAGDLAAYERTVLTALEETENALVQVSRSGRESTHLEQAAAAGLRAANMARVRFDHGSIDVLELLDAENSRLQTEDAFAQGRVRNTLAVVSLYQALAGGWPGYVPGESIAARTQAATKQ